MRLNFHSTQTKPLKLRTKNNRTGHVIVGASLSMTVTTNVHIALLLAASRAVLVTVVVPSVNVLPLVGTLLTVGVTQLSLADGANVTSAVHTPGSVF